MSLKRANIMDLRSNKTKVRFYREASLPLNLGETVQKRELLQVSPTFNTYKINGNVERNKSYVFLLNLAYLMVEKDSDLNHT